MKRGREIVQSCMSVDESCRARVCMRFSQLSLILVKREQELLESSQTRVCMSVFSTLMSPCQARTRFTGELTSESLHKRFLSSNNLFKR